MKKTTPIVGKTQESNTQFNLPSKGQGKTQESNTQFNLPSKGQGKTQESNTQFNLPSKGQGKTQESNTQFNLSRRRVPKKSPTTFSRNRRSTWNSDTESILAQGDNKYASTELILLSIINNKIGIIPDLYEIIFRHIKRVQLMKKTISMFGDNQKINDIKKIISSYITCVDRIKRKLLGNDKNIFNNLMITHKCIMAPILKNNSLICNELIIYVPDLFPINESDPINNISMGWGYYYSNVWHKYFDTITMNDIFSVDNCDDFVIKNPIYGELYECIMKKINWQIYKCNHPILNLLLSDGYIQCGVMEHKDYYFIGFLRHEANKKITLQQAKKIENFNCYQFRNRKKITLVTPKKEDIINFKPFSLCKIVEEFIVMMQNIRNNFSITTDIPCYKILCNGDVEKFIKDYGFFFRSGMINDFKSDMRQNKNNCYYEYIKAYNEYKIITQNSKNINHANEFEWTDFISDVDEKISLYIRKKYDSNKQRERYNLNFRMVEFMI